MNLLASIGTVAVIAAASLTAISTPAWAAVSTPYTLQSDKLKVGFGADGSIQSLKLAGDLFDTEYVMNPDVAPDQGNEPNSKYKQWLGNLMFSYANGTGAVSQAGVGSNPWKTAWTTQSADSRTVTATANEVKVVYGTSTNAEGVNGFTVTQTFSLAEDGSLLWKQDVKNTSGTRLVIGDWGVPIPGNELWNSGGEIYEQRAVTHSYVGKNGSYVTLERPSGQGPFVMLAPDTDSGMGFEYQDRWRTEEVGNTSWAWNQAQEGSNIKGLNVYYAHSAAIQKTNRGYLGSTSTAIEPNATKSYSMRIAKVNDDQQLKDTLFAQNSLDSTVVPGMIVPFDQTADVALRVKGTITSVTARNLNDLKGASPTNPSVAADRTNGDYKIYRVGFDRTQLGANHLTVKWNTPSGQPREGVLQFYVVDKVADLLDAHANFMTTKTQWTPADNLPAGDVRLYTFDDWMMNASDGAVPTSSNPPQGRRNSYGGYWGLGDDWGLPHGEFLAEKLVALPVASQVEALNKYLDVAVWQTLMGNTDANAAPKYTVYDFWEQGKPGSANTTPAYRGYAYPHVYNTFFSMYKIAKQNPNLISYAHTPKWYLQTTYGIFKELYDGPVAYNWHTGLMGELTTPDLIRALRAEGLNTEANDVEAKMATKYSNFSSNKYPYGSEYSYDNTGEEAVYTLAKLNLNGDTANGLRMMRDIVAKTEAARGRQPVWFGYSNPVTITGENWWQFQYSASLAGYTLDDYINNTAALETGSNAVSAARRAEMQRLNYGGKVAMLATINSGQISDHPANIGASAWTYQAERGNLGTLGVGGGQNVQLLNGWRGMTGESDLGIWGALQTLSADVITDDPIFGKVAYSANTTEDQYSTTVIPRDGLQRRLNMVTQQLSVDLNNDQYTEAIVAKNNSDLRLTMRNVTGAAHSGSVEVKGLAQGSYAVVVNGQAQGKVNNYTPAGTALASPLTVNFQAPAGQSYIVQLVSAAPDANKAPTVDAGPDQSGLKLGLDAINLNGTLSDDGLGSPNGTLAARWTATTVPSGANVTFTNADSARTGVSVNVAGTYVFTLTGSDGSLSSTDTVKVTVDPLQPLPADWVTYTFDSSSNGSVPDTSGNNNALALKGTAATAKDGNATILRLDGSNGSYAQLPADILSRSQDALAISMRVRLGRTGMFDRIFDFGSDTQKYMFLTPKLPNGNLGFAISKNGNGAETQITTDYVFPANTWVDVKLTFQRNQDGTTTGTIFANGAQVGQNAAMSLAPKDLGRTTSNYLGKSQFPDPYLLGDFDSFEIDGTLSPLRLEATASTRKVGGKAYVTVNTVNRSTVPVKVDVVTAYGKKSFTTVQPGQKVSVSINSTRSSIPAGTATVTATATVDGKTVTSSAEVSYNAQN
ncbi:MAG: DUF5695 domain-containing protein [Microbacterium enclense]